MQAQKRTYSGRQKRALRSLHRVLSVVRQRMLRLLRSGVPRSITSSLVDQIILLDQKLQDAEYHLRTAEALLEPSTREAITVAVTNIADLAATVTETVFHSSRRTVADVIDQVATNVLSAWQDVSEQLSSLRHTPAPVRPNDNMKQFLLGIGSRGWKVRSMDEQLDDELGPYALSDAMLRAARRPQSELLATDQASGLVRFPVILSGAKLPPAALQACTQAPVDYELEAVFGRYLMVRSMVLMGLHKELVGTVEDAASAITNFRKASTCFATDDSASWVLNTCEPVLSPRRYGSHYYCPVMPVTALSAPRFELGAWTALFV